MADKRRRRRNPVTRLIEDIVDDTKDLVDDVIDRAKDVEHDSRRAVRKAVDGDGAGRDDRSAREMEELKSAIDDLTAKVARLASLQSDARKTAS